jgi:hypothetical protein
MLHHSSYPDEHTMRAGKHEAFRDLRGCIEFIGKPA